MEGRDIIKGIGAFVAVVIVLLGLAWLFTGNDFFLYKYFAPKQAAVQREVFENTPSFIKGNVQELENMRFQYNATQDPDAKAAMASTILQRAAGFNLNDPDVPADLRAFVEKLKAERNAPASRPTEKSNFK